MGAPPLSYVVPICNTSMRAMREAGGAGGMGAHLDVLDHAGREELAAQQNVPERGHLQLVDEPHPAPPQDLPVSVVHGEQTAGTPAASSRFRATATAPSLLPRTRPSSSPALRSTREFSSPPGSNSPARPLPAHLAPPLSPVQPPGPTPAAPPPVHTQSSTPRPRHALASLTHAPRQNSRPLTFTETRGGSLF